MKKITISITFLLLFYAGCVAPPQSVSSEVTSIEESIFTSSKWDYPETRKVDVTDNYHGTVVRDEYRWLEDDNSEETASWITAQNEMTFGYLDQIPFRNRIKDRLTELWDYPKYGTPFKEGGKYYFFKNEGLQNQSVLYVQDELDSEARLVIDPNSFSEDGTIALSGLSFSHDGRYIAYGKSSSGSDWRQFFVRDLETREDLSDHLKWIKFTGLAWRGDGFYYSRYPEPKEGDELKGLSQASAIYFHKLKTDQSEDILFYEEPENPLMYKTLSITEDEHYLILNRSMGTHGNAISVMDLTANDEKWMSIISDFEGEHSVVDNIDNRLLVLTDRNASMNRLVLIDPINPDESNWKDIVPEGNDKLSSATVVNGNIVARYMVDVASQIRVYNIEGKYIRNIELPAMGSAGGISGERDDPEMFFSFSSFAYPPTTFRYDMEDDSLSIFRETKIMFEPNQYTTDQVFYSSKDGTKIPIFLTYKKGLKKDGSNPTLLYAYGGFNISRTPGFSVSNIVLLENGGIYASANIRGGGEYGDAWHRAGMLANKQNVYDDFISAAEYLISEGYTSSNHLAIRGGSNGGLLIGAVLNQRPELYKVAFPAVGVMDMLRYHKFTVGWGWAVEYGSSNNSDHFNFLYSYSPLHNIRENGNYPATLVTTADHDDRVVPAHSFKYAATLQGKNRGNPDPLLIRIEQKAGHGGGKPTAKRIQEAADIWSFMFYNMGITPK